MTALTQDQARARLRELVTERQRLADAEPAAILNAIDAGVQQADIARDLKRSREHIRRVARAHGIEGDQ